MIHASKITCTMRRDLYDILCRSFHTNRLEFSIFGGTPSPQQKTTIQIYNGYSILGYCKISSKSNILLLFQKEEKLLSYLRSKDITCAPKPLFCGKSNDLYLFLQSSYKTIHSKSIHNFGKIHFEFVQTLYQKTKVDIPFYDTNFYQDIIYLEGIKKNFRITDRKNLARSIDIITTYYSRKHIFSFYHGDFTPWNTFVEKDRLYPFDFEYAEKTFPPYMDLIHFILETARIEKKMKVTSILNYFDRFKKKFKIKNVDFNILCLAYLIHILASYNKTYDGHFSQADSGYIFWTKSMSLLLKRIQGNTLTD